MKHSKYACKQHDIYIYNCKEYMIQNYYVDTR